MSLTPQQLLDWQESPFQTAIGDVTKQLNIVNALGQVALEVTKAKQAFDGAAANAHTADTLASLTRISTALSAGHAILTAIHEKSARLAKCKAALEMVAASADSVGYIKKFEQLPGLIEPTPAQKADPVRGPLHISAAALMTKRVAAIMAEANTTDMAGYIKIGAEIAKIAALFASKDKPAEAGEASSTGGKAQAPTQATTGTATTPVTSIAAPMTTVGASTVLAGMVPASQAAMGGPAAGQALSGATGATGAMAVRPMAGATAGSAAVTHSGGGYIGAPLGAVAAPVEQRRAAGTDWLLEEDAQMWAGRTAPTEDGVVA